MADQQYISRERGIFVLGIWLMQFRGLASPKSIGARWQAGNSVRVDIASLNLKSTKSRTAPWETQVQFITVLRKKNSFFLGKLLLKAFNWLDEAPPYYGGNLLYLKSSDCDY